MCSWCWGFSPVIEAVEARHGGTLPIRLIVGGLRPGTTAPMSEAARREIRGHWEHVREASGQPFGVSVCEREGFVYDTDPASRAVVLARRADPGLALPFLRAAHAAFYVDGADVTQPEVLADLAAGLGMDRDAFAAGLAEEAVKQETWRDYAISQGAGVKGFPTLIIGPMANGEYAPITRGYQGAVDVLRTIDGWLAIHGASAA
jgi:putative protein-disulfide isomerase